MPDFVRVRDKSTRHEYDVPAKHPKIGTDLEPLNDPKRWPDLSGVHARPRPAVYRTDKAGAPAPSPTGSAAPQTTVPTPAAVTATKKPEA